MLRLSCTKRIFGGVRIGRRQLLHEQGLLLLGALFINARQAFSGEWFDSSQQAAGAMLAVGVVLFGGATRLWIERSHYIAEEKAGPLIQGRSSKHTTG
jgi:hypothetical protein